MTSQTVLAVAHILLVLTMPILLIGVVNRVRSRWAGRQGPGLWQSFWDLRRLLRKTPVVSATTTPLFAAGAWIVLAASLLAAMIAPILGAAAPLHFSYDFVLFAYTLGLARIFLMLSAMDVGSAFEGMGAAREASFTAFVEPAFFLLVSCAGITTGETSLSAMLGHWHQAAAFPWLAAPAVVVLLLLLQAEASRVPVDDPATHLELTMVHEVMILDHSGPELAAMQYASAVKMTTYAGMIAALLSPVDPVAAPALAVVAGVAIMLAVAALVGCIESLVARLQMRLVPRYLVLASLIAGAGLGIAGWLGRG